MADIHGTREELIALIGEQRGEIERLRAAFNTYAWHLPNCKGSGDKDGKYDLEHCDCGFRDIRFGYEQRPIGEEK